MTSPKIWQCGRGKKGGRCKITLGEFMTPIREIQFTNNMSLLSKCMLPLRNRRLDYSSHTWGKDQRGKPQHSPCDMDRPSKSLGRASVSHSPRLHSQLSHVATVDPDRSLISHKGAYEAGVKQHRWMHCRYGDQLPLPSRAGHVNLGTWSLPADEG